MLFCKVVKFFLNVDYFEIWNSGIVKYLNKLNIFIVKYGLLFKI